MSVFFTRRGTPKSKTAVVTITGTGNSSYCYATIGDTKYYSAAGGIEVMAGDVITFGIRGYNTKYAGQVTIDGASVATSTNKNVTTYNWTVPEGVSAIAIAFSYISSPGYGTITVTTS